MGKTKTRNEVENEKQIFGSAAVSFDRRLRGGKGPASAAHHGQRHADSGRIQPAGRSGGEVGPQVRSSADSLHPETRRHEAARGRTDGHGFSAHASSGLHP